MEPRPCRAAPDFGDFYAVAKTPLHFFGDDSLPAQIDGASFDLTPMLPFTADAVSAILFHRGLCYFKCSRLSWVDDAT